MKKLMVCAFAITIMYNAGAQVQPVNPESVAPVCKNATDSFSYAAGMSVAESMMQSGVTQLNTDLVARAMSDVYAKNQTVLTPEQANMTLQKRLQEFAEQKANAQKAEGLAFLDANKKRTGIHVLPNGLQYEIIKAGDPAGVKPKVTDTVVVNYVGTLTNGTEFDNSMKRGQAATFPVNGVIRGWTEILQLMTKGAHWKVYIPGELAYGEYPPQGAPIPPNAVLVFEIILEDIKPGQSAAN